MRGAKLPGLLALLGLLLGASLFIGANIESNSHQTSSSRPLKWSLRLSPELQANEPRYHKAIAAILGDPQGWARVGRTFEYVPSLEAADYSLMVEPEAAIKTDCRLNEGPENILGCARTALRPCPIFLAAEFNGKLALRRILNHELGHCLGLGHKQNDLMQAKFLPDSPPFYPTDAEVRKARNHLSQYP